MHLIEDTEIIRPFDQRAQDRRHPSQVIADDRPLGVDVDAILRGQNRIDMWLDLRGPFPDPALPLEADVRRADDDDALGLHLVGDADRSRGLSQARFVGIERVFST